MNGNDHGLAARAGDGIFLFTSESVGEGHPGKVTLGLFSIVQNFIVATLELLVCKRDTLLLRVHPMKK